jgi:hypothetical protein
LWVDFEYQQGDDLVAAFSASNSRILRRAAALLLFALGIQNSGQCFEAYERTGVMRVVYVDFKTVNIEYCLVHCALQAVEALAGAALRSMYRAANGIGLLISIH